MSLNLCFVSKVQEDKRTHICVMCISVLSWTLFACDDGNTHEHKIPVNHGHMRVHCDSKKVQGKHVTCCVSGGTDSPDRPRFL